METTQQMALSFIMFIVFMDLFGEDNGQLKNKKYLLSTTERKLLHQISENSLRIWHTTYSLRNNNS